MYHETPKDWENPDWGNIERVHEWKLYISDEVKTMWWTFKLDQREALARQAQEMADMEEWD